MRPISYRCVSWFICCGQLEVTSSSTWSTWRRRICSWTASSLQVWHQSLLSRPCPHLIKVRSMMKWQVMPLSWSPPRAFTQGVWLFHCRRFHDTASFQKRISFYPILFYAYFILMRCCSLLLGNATVDQLSSVFQN